MEQMHFRGSLAYSAQTPTCQEEQEEKHGHHNADNGAGAHAGARRVAAKTIPHVRACAFTRERSCVVENARCLSDGAQTVATQ